MKKEERAMERVRCDRCVYVNTHDRSWGYCYCEYYESYVAKDDCTIECDHYSED